MCPARTPSLTNMNLYQKYILPRLLNASMRRGEIEKSRPGVVGQAMGTVLEVGFGSGLNLPHYKNVLKLYALDPSSELYNLAEKRIKEASFPVEYIKASAEEIPLAENTIDTVVSTWSVCSIPRPELALKEIFRVLKPGGKFIFIEHGKSPGRFTAKWQKWLTPIFGCVSGGCHMDREVDKLISRAGFKITDLETFPQKLRPLLFMYKGVALKK